MKQYGLSKFDKPYVRTARQTRKITKQVQLPLLMKQIYSRNIHRKQITMINDPSFTLPKQSSTFQRVCSYLQQNVPVILPQSRFLLFWNIIMILILIINYIEIPIDILILTFVKVSPKQTQIYRAGNSVMLVLMAIDFFFIRFRVAYYYHQILVKKYQILIRNYIKKHFIIDLAVIIAYLIDITTFRFAEYSKLLFWLKIYTIIKLIKRVQERLVFHKYYLALFKFLKIVAFIFILTNLNACIYFATDFYYYSQQNFYYQNGFLWLTGSSTTQSMDVIQTWGWFFWYVYALYWSVQTAATTGYGDMTPRNPQTIFFCNVVMVITVVIFIIYTDKVIQFIQELQQSRSNQQQTLQNLRLYKDMNPMTKQTSNDVQKFVQQYGKLQYQEVQTLSSQLLSQQLQLQFDLQIKNEILNHIKILRDITNTSSGIKNRFAKQIIKSVKSQFYPVNTTIVDKDSINDFKLYMISFGKISMYNSSTQQQKDYTKYDYFGQDYFFFGGITHGEIFTKTFAKVTYLQRTEFLKIIKNYPEQNQKLREQIDMVQLNRKDTTNFDISCFYTHKYHLTQNTPEFQFGRDKIPNAKIESKQILGSDQDRLAYKRKNITKFKIINRFKYIPLNIQIVKNTKKYFIHDNL